MNRSRVQLLLVCTVLASTFGACSDETGAAKPGHVSELLELASGYELARGPRVPPPGFGPVDAEP